MKIYTKTGDDGSTGLFGGSRVPKFHLRVEAYGTTDELNSNIGLVRDQDISTDTKKELLKIQYDLFTIGSMLATPQENSDTKKIRNKIPEIEQNDIELLEQAIDKMQAKLPKMTHFTIPGGHRIVSYCHIARCVCRRNERLVVHLADISMIEPVIPIYLNRLSDYLFTLARKLTYDLKVEEIKWIPTKKK